MKLDPSAAHAQTAPKLVVLITVDQLRGDYVDRYARNLRGGLKRFRDEGVFYPQGRQDHANTSTAPGHATLLSGRFPARTGIVSNDLGVPDPASPLIAGATAAGASPWRFKGSTLYDWIRTADTTSLALSVGRKDRGAILSIGNARAHVYWWANNRFTSSRYYRDTLPTFVSRWNASLRPDEWKKRPWTLLLPESAYGEVDDQASEGVGAKRPRVFPHVLDSLAKVTDYPWMDSLALDLALIGARELQLGRRTSIDVLAVALASTDAIGHHFGPDSREVHDQTLRVDLWLGAFMEQLEREVPRDRIIYVLTSDHGVASMPEVLKLRGVMDAGHINLTGVVSGVVRPLQTKFLSSFGILMQSGLVLADTAAMRARGIDVAAVSRDLAAKMSAVQGISRVYTPATLRAAPATDESAGLWKRAIPPSYGWLVAVQPRANWMFASIVEAEHGTPLAPNIHVPIAFVAPGVAAARVTRVARTVDIAPTLAALLGIKPTETLDGTALREVVVRR